MSCAHGTSQWLCIVEAVVDGWRVAENLYGRDYRLLCSDVLVASTTADGDLRTRETGQLAPNMHGAGAAAEGPLVGQGTISAVR